MLAYICARLFSEAACLCERSLMFDKSVKIVSIGLCVCVYRCVGMRGPKYTVYEYVPDDACLHMSARAC